MAWEDFLGSSFSDYMLESSPSMAYFSSAPFQGGYAPAQQQYWGSQFGDVYNQYQGQLGTALKTGGTPSTFVDFLEDMPWTERYSSLSPSLRPGGGSRRFNPVARHMYS